MEYLRLIFTSDFLNAIIRMSTPVLFVAMAACISRQANVLCIAFEGILLFSALGGVIGSALTQSLWLGILLGLAMGISLAIGFAYFVMYMDTKPMLIGLALNTLGKSGSVLILLMVCGSKGNSTSMPSLTFPTVGAKFLSDIPVLGKILSGQNILTWVVVLVVILTTFLIYKTPFGLRIRAVGEDPDAAEAAGINVKRTKFIALLMAGFLCSFGGMFLSMAYVPYFTANMSAGRGFVGIAASHLGMGNPVSATIWAVVFGAADALGNLAQSFDLPSQFAQMTPYIVTLVGLCYLGFGSRHKRKGIKTSAKAEHLKKAEEEGEERH